MDGERGVQRYHHVEHAAPSDVLKTAARIDHFAQSSHVKLQFSIVTTDALNSIFSDFGMNHEVELDITTSTAYRSQEDKLGDRKLVHSRPQYNRLRRKWQGLCGSLGTDPPI